LKGPSREDAQRPSSGAEVIGQVLSGDRRAIARVISLMERGGEEARDAVAVLYRHTGRAQVIGITGAPGTGKSTLVNEMAKAYRRQGLKVGIVAVDPTSPFSGGAILGDRIRMRDVATDPHIFIRSMATRGNLGGLARATADATHVLDAAGYPIILVETVGAGQNEVDIARMAHSTVVLQMPASGDEIQAIKAGILEIADILVVNKADLPGADNMVAALQAMLDLNSVQNEWHHGRLYRTEAAGVDSTDSESWRSPVLKTCALRSEGIAELVAAIQAHWQYQSNSGLRERRERERVADELRRILRYTLLERLLSQISEENLEQTVQHVVAREQDPYSAAETLIQQAGLVSQPCVPLTTGKG
jgi:LAO/AO transport system kinase